MVAASKPSSRPVKAPALSSLRAASSSLASRSFFGWFSEEGLRADTPLPALALEVLLVPRPILLPAAAGRREECEEEEEEPISLLLLATRLSPPPAAPAELVALGIPAAAAAAPAGVESPEPSLVVPVLLIATLAVRCEDKAERPSLPELLLAAPVEPIALLPADAEAALPAAALAWGTAFAAAATGDCPMAAAEAMRDLAK